MTGFFGFDALFSQANCRYMVIDLSRRVTRISRADFNDIEQNRVAYPFAIKQRAQFAIAYWQQQQTSPWIWFLSFPLDERGLLSQAAIGDFIQYTASRLGAIDGGLTEQQQQALGNNPYIVTPTEDKKALFHAILTHELTLAASDFYLPVQQYCQTQHSGDAWQQLGLQGFADLVVRADSDDNHALIVNGLKFMPSTPKYALLGMLEHVGLATPVAEVLFNQLALESKREQLDIFYIAALIRALAGAKPSMLNAVIELVFADSALQHKEVLIAISGRVWHALELDGQLARFLLLVAKQQDPVFFQQVLADLALLTSIRPKLLQLLHSKPDALLAQAIDQLRAAV